jgi:hypothetical protein
MTYHYAERAVWLFELDSPDPSGTGYAFCTSHADRMSPPLGWTLTDRRNVTRLFAPVRSVVA